MRKMIVNTFMTLDGVMQPAGGPEGDADGGFEHDGWAFGYWYDVVDEAMHSSMAPGTPAGGLEIINSKVSPSRRST